MFDLVVVLAALGLLMYLAFRGFTLLILAPALALLTAFVTGGLPVLGGYTQVFMSNTGDFIVAFFPLFMLGAIFGKLMDDSTVACTLGQWLARSPAGHCFGGPLLRRADLRWRLRLRCRLRNFPGGRRAFP